MNENELMVLTPTGLVWVRFNNGIFCVLRDATFTDPDLNANLYKHDTCIKCHFCI